MDIITLDFETYFADEYTLSKMTTESYVRDPRFEAHGCAIKYDREPAQWYEGAELQEMLESISDHACLCHHAQFDGLILSHHYGIRPAMWLDTMSMARALIGNHLSVGLDALAKHFGLSAKTVPYSLFRGRHWDELAADVQVQVARGACHDVELTRQLFQILRQDFPAEEYGLVDATVRMFTEPSLVGNVPLLQRVVDDEAAARAGLLDELEVTAKQLGSDPVFADLLRREGVELAADAYDTDPEAGDAAESGVLHHGWKLAKRGPKYAFSKTDPFMRELLESEDERVRTLAEARLGEKSTLARTRPQRLLEMAQRGSLCVYLKYAGAHTMRWSGGDRTNWQNFKRPDPDAPESAGNLMLESIQAPPGYLLATADASQIECRLLNTVAGQQDVVERFRRKEDPYVSIASQFYGFEVTKAYPKERGTGKQLELSCGYGAGGPTIKATAAKGAYGPPVFLSDEQATYARDLYRSTHPAVVAYWRQANQVLAWLAAGLERDWYPFHTARGRLYGPNGLFIDYSTLEWDGKEWSVATRKGKARIYGAKLVENAIQFLARIHNSQAWVRCRGAGMHMVSMEHDKLIALVNDDSSAHDALAYLQEQLARPPEWLPGVPLDSDGYVSRTYAKGT